MSEELSTSFISIRPKLVERISQRLMNDIKTDVGSNVEQSDPMEKLVKCVENLTVVSMNQHVATLQATLRFQEIMLKQQEKQLITLTSSHQEVIKQLGERSQAGLLLPLTVRDLVTLGEREAELSQLMKEEKYVTLGFEVVIRGSSRTEEMLVRQKIEALVTEVRTRSGDDHKEVVQDVVKAKKSTTEELTPKEAVLHYNDQESCESLEVSNLEAAALILGVDKKVLYSIQEETGARITVSGKASNSKREVKMTGSKEALVMVREEVARVIKEGVHEGVTLTRGMLGMLVRAKMDSIERKSGATVTFGGKVNDDLREVVLSGSKKSTQAGLTVLIDMIGVCKRMVLPAPGMAAKLVGFKGQTIRSIEEKSGAIVTVDVCGDRYGDSREVVISGSEKAVQKAITIVKDIVQDSKIVSMTPDTIQWLLEGGRNIQRIRKESGADVDVTGKLGDEDRKVIFSGSKKAINKALSMM